MRTTTELRCRYTTIGDLLTPKLFPLLRYLTIIALNMADVFVISTAPRPTNTGLVTMCFDDKAGERDSRYGSVKDKADIRAHKGRTVRILQ